MSSLETLLKSNSALLRIVMDPSCSLSSSDSFTSRSKSASAFQVLSHQLRWCGKSTLEKKKTGDEGSEGSSQIPMINLDLVLI